MRLTCKISKLRLIVASFFLLNSNGCESGVDPVKTDKSNIKVSWQSGLRCLDGSYLGAYTGDISISNLLPGDSVKIFYGDSLAVDTVESINGPSSFQIVQIGERILKKIKIVSSRDTFEVNAYDSMQASNTVSGSQNIPFPIYIKTNFDSITQSVTTMNYYTGFNRIKCGFENKMLVDTIRTHKNSGVFSIDMLADTYANEYSIFAMVIDSNGVVWKAGEYSSNFGINYGTKVPYKQGKLHFEAYLPYLPANIWIPLDGGMGDYHIRIENIK